MNLALPIWFDDPAPAVRLAVRHAPPAVARCAARSPARR